MPCIITICAIVLRLGKIAGVDLQVSVNGGGNYWVAGDFYVNYGLGVDTTDTGAYIQPFAFSWDVRFKNNYRGSGMPGIPATPTHLIDLYKFECEIRWTTLGGVPIPGVVGGGWPDKCVLGHNTLESRGFFADATECDELYNPGGGCNVTDNPPDAYRLWPIGSYKVEVLIDGEIIVQNVFSVAEFERSDPWPLDMPEERPENHGRGPVYYSSVGVWPAGLPYGADYYLNNLNCLDEELCSVVHPWEYPLSYGSSGGAYEVRPLWGDYSVPIGEPRSAPKPETHTGFDFVYPWCPRLDWCYQGQSGDPDPCVEDVEINIYGEEKHCVPDWCPRNLAGNPDSPQAVIFLASIADVMMGS